MNLTDFVPIKGMTVIRPEPPIGRGEHRILNEGIFGMFNYQEVPVATARGFAESLLHALRERGYAGRWYDGDAVAFLKRHGTPGRQEPLLLRLFETNEGNHGLHVVVRENQFSEGTTGLVHECMTAHQIPIEETETPCEDNTRVYGIVFQV